jgi:hypothetical protein
MSVDQINSFFATVDKNLKIIHNAVENGYVITHLDVHSKPYRVGFIPFGQLDQFHPREFVSYLMQNSPHANGGAVRFNSIVDKENAKIEEQRKKDASERIQATAREFWREEKWLRGETVFFPEIISFNKTQEPVAPYVVNDKRRRLALV